MERLRESASTLTQQLVDAVAKAERAERDGQEAAAAAAAMAGAAQGARHELARALREGDSAAREEAERLKAEMEKSLAEVRIGAAVRWESTTVRQAATRSRDKRVHGEMCRNPFFSICARPCVRKLHSWEYRRPDGDCHSLGGVLSV